MGWRTGKFNGRLYGPLGFSPEDGDGVCYSFYEWEQSLINGGHVYRPNGGGSHREIKEYLMIRDHAICHYCGDRLTYRQATVDHYFPPEDWYKSEIDLCDSVTNLVIACYPCNFIKGKKSPIGYMVRDRKDMRLRIRLLRFVKRKTTHIKLILQGTRTITGRHKGIDMYRAMTAAERKEARYARFKDDLIGAEV